MAGGWLTHRGRQNEARGRLKDPSPNLLFSADCAIRQTLEDFLGDGRGSAVGTHGITHWTVRDTRFNVGVQVPLPRMRPIRDLTLRAPRRPLTYSALRAVITRLNERLGENVAVSLLRPWPYWVRLPVHDPSREMIRADLNPFKVR